jgi:hypothetical protein
MNVKYIFGLCSLLFSTFALTTSAANSTSTEKKIVVKVQSITYEIGYQIGDVARQTIMVITPSGYQFDESSLPAKGKGVANMELRNAQWQVDETGNTSQHKLELEWQIFRVMQETRAYSLKPLDLQFSSKSPTDKVLTVHVHPARVLVSSVLPTSMDAVYTQPRFDVAPQARNTRPMIVTLSFGLVGLLLSGFYFAWRFDWLPARFSALFAAPKPFRSAYRQIQSLQKITNHSEQVIRAMLALRRACDATAGATISAERVGLLFKHNGRLAKKRTEIESFYAESERAFFAGNASSFSLNQLKQLSRQLMALESA